MARNSVNLIVVVERLFEWLSKISFRFWFIACAIVLSTGPIGLLQLSVVDRWVLNVSSYLVPVKSGASEIAVIEVSDDEYNVWEKDIHAAGNLTSLLANILYSSTANVGVLFHKPLTTSMNRLEQALNDSLNISEKPVSSKKQKGKTDDTDGKRLAIDIHEQKIHLIDLLNNPRVVLGVPAEFGRVYPSIPHETFSPLWANNWYWNWCTYCVEQESVRTNTQADLNYYAYSPSRDLQSTLLSRSSLDVYFPTFLWRVYLSSILDDSTVFPPLSWDSSAGFFFGENILPASIGGGVVSLNEASLRWAARIVTMSLDEALSVSSFPEFVFVLPQSQSHYASFLANSIYGLRYEQTLSQPWWLEASLYGFSLLFSVFIAIAVSYLSSRRIFILVIVTLGFMFALSLACIVYYRLWFPISALMNWVLLSALLMSVWNLRRQRKLRLHIRNNKTVKNLASSLSDRKLYKEAFNALKLHLNPRQLKAEFYTVGEKLDQQGKSQEAREVFVYLCKLDRKFRNVQQRSQRSSPSVRQKKSSATTQKITSLPVKKSPGVTHMGRYQIQRELGRGAMGVVYLGYDPNIARSVAIKVLDYAGLSARDLNDAKARFFREAKAAGRLNHPNIVSIYDVGEQDEVAFIAMDFVAGEPLNGAIRDDGSALAFDVYRIVHDVALALEYAHQNGIVHRDIKPGNIIYSPHPYQVKVADFGIARLMDASKTSTGEIFGSPLYMSPEQLKGEKVGPASDVYSLGVTFFQLLSGKLPFDGDNLASLAYEVIHGKPKSIRSVRKGLPASSARIINQCLQKNIGDRYESAGELATALNKAIRRDFSVEAKKAGFTL